MSHGTLTQAAEEYKFFTHGALFTHGGWPRDPLNDYVIEWNPEHAPFVIDLPAPAFLGLICTDEYGKLRSEWCNKLLAVHLDGWEDLFMFMSTVGAVNRDKGYLARLMAQLIPVPDVLALAQTGMIAVCPTVDVVTFGIDSNKRSVYFEPALDLHTGLPWVKTGPPDAETVELAASFFAQAEEPHLAADTKAAEAQVNKALAQLRVNKLYV